MARTGVTPNGISAIGFLLNALAAVLVARDALVAAGAVMLFGSALDLVDGALARATGQASRFGAIFDAVLDRYSEGAVLLGIALHLVGQGDERSAVLVFAALTGSVLVSYVRAYAETLGFPLREGWFTRVERVLLTALALLISGWWAGALVGALWLLAVLTNLTALQRLYHVWAYLRAERISESEDRR